VPDLSDIIAQETQDGRLIVRFLVSAMNDQLSDFQPCHRLDAARLLVKLGFEQAQTFVDHAAIQRAARRHRQPGSESAHAAHRIRSELAQIVREETDHGRTAVRFLISAMQGELDGFKPCHRLSAAKVLLHRGFDCPSGDSDAQDDTPAEPDPEVVEAERRRAEDIEFSTHGPVYYATYKYPCPCEDRRHNCNGELLGDREREVAVRRSPGKEVFIPDNDLEAFKARYAQYQTRRNAENPDRAIDISRIRWRYNYYTGRYDCRDPATTPG